jgi:hypothetical protein
LLLADVPAWLRQRPKVLFVIARFTQELENQEINGIQSAKALQALRHLPRLSFLKG